MHPIPRARVSSVLAALLLALAAGAALPHAQAPAGTTAFEAARVIVGDGSAPIENATIVVTAGRIAAGGTGRQGHRAGRRGAGQPGRQDRDADHPRHPRAPQHDARRR